VGCSEIHWQDGQSVRIDRVVDEATRLPYEKGRELLGYELGVWRCVLYTMSGYGDVLGPRKSCLARRDERIITALAKASPPLAIFEEAG